MNNKKIIKISIIYIFTSIFTNVVSFFIIPLYTNNISVSEFGQYNIIVSLQSFLSIFITISLFSGMARFLNEYEDKNRIKNITLTFTIIWGTIFNILVYIISPYVSPYLFEHDINYNIFFYITLNATFLGIISIYFTYFSVQFQALKASLISILNQISLIILVYIFLIILNRGVLGILQAHMIIYTTSAFVLIITDIKGLKLVFANKELKEQLIFSLGIIPGQISNWILTLIDRYFIRGLLTLSAVGIYSLGYRVGMLFQTLFLVPFMQMFTPFKYSVYNFKNSKEKIKNAYHYYNLIGWMIILLLSLFSKHIIFFLGTKDYADAISLVPIIAISYYFWGLTDFFSIGLVMENKMIIKSFAVIIGGITNIGLNIYLIPVMGIYGAALSTVLSYIIINLTVYFRSKKIYNLEVGFFDSFKYGLPFIIIFPTYIFTSQIFEGILIELIIIIILICLYLIIGYFGKIFTKEDLEKLFSLLKKYKRGSDNE